MKTVLLTGASGFIGRQALPILRNHGYEIHAVSRALVDHAFEAQDDHVHWHNANLPDRDGARSLIRKVKASHLLHFAWYVEPGLYWTSEQNIAWQKASLDLVKDFRDSGGERVVVAGSCAESGTTLYGDCKRVLSEDLRRYARESGLSQAWGRIFFLYGPGEYPSRLVPSVINALLAGKTAHCTSGQQIRDVLYVKDVADAFVALLDSEHEGTFELGSGPAVPIKDLIAKIAQILESPDRIALGALPARPDEPSELVADVTRLFHELAWRPRYDLERGPRETIEWWKRKQ